MLSCLERCCIGLVDKTCNHKQNHLSHFAEFKRKEWTSTTSPGDRDCKGKKSQLFSQGVVNNNEHLQNCAAALAGFAASFMEEIGYCQLTNGARKSALRLPETVKAADMANADQMYSLDWHYGCDFEARV